MCASVLTAWLKCPRHIKLTACVCVCVRVYQPSSSSRAAEALRRDSGVIPGFVGFDRTANPDLSYVPAVHGLDEVDNLVDAEFRLVLRKMSKRDATTRLKVGWGDPPPPSGEATCTFCRADTPCQHVLLAGPLTASSLPVFGRLCRTLRPCARSGIQRWSRGSCRTGPKSTAKYQW